MRIILGSQSKGRKRVLEKILKPYGLDFHIIPADIDEKSIGIRSGIRVKHLVKKLAHAKATSIWKKLDKDARGLLVTSDQVVVCAGVVYEKPETAEEVFQFWKTYRTYPAETVTSVVVTQISSGFRLVGVDKAKIWFEPVPNEVIQAYIDTGDPFTQAGGFDHEHPVVSPYVKKIEGEPESITGLPMKLTKRLLSSFSSR